MNVWEAIGIVSSGITLVAFMVAAAYAAYRYRAGSTERMIRGAPAESRARLVEAELKHFPVGTEGLTREQKYNLVLVQIEAHSRTQNRRLVAICFVALLSATVAAYALLRVPTAATVTPNPASAPPATAKDADRPAPASSSTARSDIASAPASSSTRSSSPASVSHSPASRARSSSRPSSAAHVTSVRGAKAESKSPRTTETTETQPTEPSRPARKITLVVELLWDQGEGATPGMQVPKIFSCGPWSPLPPLDGRPDYPRKRRVCTASVMESGSGTLALDARLGQVYIAYMYQLEGQGPKGGNFHWVEKGRKVEATISWTLN